MIYRRPMFKAEPMEFAGFAELPRREKSKLQKVWDNFQQLKRLMDEKGVLITQSCAARLLDVSPQRVGQLVGEGRLETFEFQGAPLVTENSIIEFAKTERKAGRPMGTPTTIKEAWKRASGPVRK